MATRTTTRQPKLHEIFSDEDVAQIIGSAWLSTCPKDNKLNFICAKNGLMKAIKALQPVTPMPRNEWYKTVFGNFDTDRDGFLNYTAFEEIVRQYYDHHKQKHRLKQLAGRQTASPAASTTASTTPKSSSPTSDGGAITLASHVMCPAHIVACQIFRDYEFLDTAKLGRGSFGTVQVVQHRRTGERCACKRIPVTQVEQWDLIQTEIQLMKTLNHPNILRLHETYHDGHTIYLLMELCQGGQLFDRIVRHYDDAKQPITEELVAEWMRQIASATAYCHSKKIVHRDMKPENILFVDNSDNSPIKVIDFGLSSTMDVLRRNQKEIVERRTGVGAFMAKVLPKINGKTIVETQVKRVRMQRAGTPHYMAPEMIRGDYDEKCDVFSAGVIMYQLLSGVHPFYIHRVDTEETVRQKILFDHPPTVGDAWTRTSPEAKKLVRWMLEKQPSKRCTADEALQHEWFKNTQRPVSGLGSQLLGSVFDGLKNWQNHNRLKQAVLQLLAKKLSEHDIQALRKKFMKLDKMGDGTITIDELRLSMQEAGYEITEADIEKICSSLDTSGDNMIGYNEFISALLASRWQFQEPQLREVFNKFDVTQEGYITIDNLKTALKGHRSNQLTDTQLEVIFSEIDVDGDGRVDFDEFMALMTN
eukprot:Lankesteria_metandrocarpae@DN3289_c0_g1_i1.p1